MSISISSLLVTANVLLAINAFCMGRRRRRAYRSEWHRTRKHYFENKAASCRKKIALNAPLAQCLPDGRARDYYGRRNLRLANEAERCELAASDHRQDAQRVGIRTRLIGMVIAAICGWKSR
jgi:hypothetical protein